LASGTENNTMKHVISTDRRTLVAIITDDEQKQLRGLPDIQSDAALHEFLEPLVANSELEWVSPEETGDLTAAPMLGVRASEQDRKDYTDEQDRKHYRPPIIERWAYMDYQIRSPLEDLRDTGRVVFAS